MYWNLYENQKMVGVFALSSVFDKPKAVKKFMTQNHLQSNEIANNIVYCLHGQQDKNAGTKFLRLLREDAITWWKERYGDDLKAFQTFILPPRNGAIYKADNWKVIGKTSGNAQRIRTIPKQDIHKYKNVMEKTFSNGQVRYVIKWFEDVEKKIILMRLVSKKELCRSLKLVKVQMSLLNMLVYSDA
jgi:hypothetical protein